MGEEPKPSLQLVKKLATFIVDNYEFVSHVDHQQLPDVDYVFECDICHIVYEPYSRSIIPKRFFKTIRMGEYCIEMDRTEEIIVLDALMKAASLKKQDESKLADEYKQKTALLMLKKIN